MERANHRLSSDGDMGKEQFEQSSKKVSCGARFGWAVFIASLIAGVVPVGAGAAVNPAVQTEATTLSASMPATPASKGVIPAAGLSNVVGPTAGYTKVAVAYAAEPVATGGRTSTADTATVTVPPGKKDAHFQMPYALVLALVALIGLVPVSRRPRH